MRLRILQVRFVIAIICTLVGSIGAVASFGSNVLLPIGFLNCFLAMFQIVFIMGCYLRYALES